MRGGGGVALKGARVTGVRVTPISGMSDCDGADRRGGVYPRVGATVIWSADGGGGGSGGGGGGAISGDSAGAGLDGAGDAVVGLLDGTSVDSSTPPAEPRVKRTTPVTTSATAATAAAAPSRRRERYQGPVADTLKSHAPLLASVDSHDLVGGMPSRPVRGASMALHCVSSGGGT